MEQSLEQEIRGLSSRFHSLHDEDGRAFVSLADAYRRAGDLLRAKLVLAEGLRRHPDFASAHVIAVRMSRDVSNDGEALEAARRVLTLDPENLEARRAVAEIAPRVEDGGARAEGNQADRGEGAALSDTPWMTGDTGVWNTGADSGLASVDPEAWTAVDSMEVAGRLGERESDTGPSDGTPAPEDEAPFAVAESDGAEAGAATPGDSDPGAFAVREEDPPPAAEPDGAPTEVPGESEQESAEVESGSVGLQTATSSSARPEMQGRATERSESARAAPAAGGSPGRGTLSEEEASRPDSHREPRDSGADDDVIYTRTMARLYEQQGLLGRAISVCRRLVEANPEDIELAEHLESLRRRAEEEVSSPALGDPPASEARAPDGAPSPPGSEAPVREVVVVVPIEALAPDPPRIRAAGETAPEPAR